MKLIRRNTFETNSSSTHALVIISKDDEQDKKKEDNKKQQKRNNNVGFVERKQDKNYNIVYRNKPTKPMTVSELFGLKKGK